MRGEGHGRRGCLQDECVRKVCQPAFQMERPEQDDYSLHDSDITNIAHLKQ